MRAPRLLVRARRLATVVLCILCTSVALGGRLRDPGNLYKIQVRQIAVGVYFAYRAEPLRYWVEGNSTIIINDRDVVVVDAGGEPETARNTIAEIKKLTRNPVRYLINTHDHVDHTLGNQVYLESFPGIEIIAHPAAREALDTDGRNYILTTLAEADSISTRGEELYKRLRDENTFGVEKVIEYWRRYELEDSRRRFEQYRQAVVTLPTTTVDGKLVLFRGARTIEIMHLGHGDTPGDLVVYLPHEKVVCSGDMVTEPVPYGFTVQPFEWVKTLGKLAELDFDYLIPGHGEVQPGKQYVRRLIAMEQSLQAQVREAVASGLDLEATRKRVDLSAFRSAFTHDDPVAEYRFTTWYQRPAVASVFAMVKDGTALPP